MRNLEKSLTSNRGEGEESAARALGAGGEEYEGCECGEEGGGEAGEFGGGEGGYCSGGGLGEVQVSEWWGMGRGGGLVDFWVV